MQARNYRGDVGGSRPGVAPGIFQQGGDSSDEGAKIPEM